MENKPKEYEFLHEDDKNTVDGYLFALEDLNNCLEFSQELSEFELPSKMYELIEEYIEDYKSKVRTCMKDKLEELITARIESGDYEKEIEEGKFE